MEISDEMIRRALGQCEDLNIRQLLCQGQRLYVYAIDGLVSGSDGTDSVVKPMIQQLRGDSMEALYHNALSGQIYNSVVRPCETMEDVLNKLLNGFTVVLFPGVGALAFETKTGEKRGIAPPTVENTVKGPKDAFTETLRTNTSILRRHLRSPKLRLEAIRVGSVSMTQTVVVWLEGITDSTRVERMRTRLKTAKVRELLTPAAVEQTITRGRATPFPLLQYTERPDKFAQGLLSGRVGVLVDGLPLGYLAPVDLGYLMYSPEDYGGDPLSAACIRVLRYGALALSLLLPAVYIALTVFHQDMLPLPLLRAVIESRRAVPFSVVTEVLALLVAFELLQEAAVHLPQSIEQSVSIIGGIVVGTAAVEASLISPGALIVVSLAGICGFALPNRDLAAGIRLTRFALALVGAVAGLFGICVGVLGLLIHLSGIDSLSEPYLAPFSELESAGILGTRTGEEA